jgi:DNA topoisomerase-3
VTVLNSLQRQVRGSQYIKNYDFVFDFGHPWGTCQVTMTSVIGHLTDLKFPPDIERGEWKYPPPINLFSAPVRTTVAEVSGVPRADGVALLNVTLKDKACIAHNIQNEARSARVLFIWTDCDREGEHIGTEVREAALKGNGRLEVKRAKFSNIERA